MKDNLGFSSSMAHRKRFTKLFEEQAFEAVRNNKYVVDEKVMGEIAQRVAIKVYNEIREQQRALHRERYGKAIMPDVKFEGPREIREKVGEDKKFTANPYRDEVKK